MALDELEGELEEVEEVEEIDDMEDEDEEAGLLDEDLGLDEEDEEEI